ncbi:MAG: ribosome-associated translation inhibitor RaiA [Gammaproteobacteria bacterium]|jgi:ribosomal subunit interface protein
MKLPLEITFRHMERSDALTANIEERAAQLDKFVDNIMRCHVVVESPHQHKQQGKIFKISIDLTVPGHEITVSRDRHKNHAHEDPYVAIRDAFDAAKRQLQNLSTKRRGDVKYHETPPHGIVSELVPTEGFGKIASADGREIYFHRNSLLNGDFDALQPGDKVRYDEEMGEKGPQASSVKLLGKHNIV